MAAKPIVVDELITDLDAPPPELARCNLQPVQLACAQGAKWFSFEAGMVDCVLAATDNPNLSGVAVVHQNALYVYATRDPSGPAYAIWDARPPGPKALVPLTLVSEDAPEAYLVAFTESQYTWPTHRDKDRMFVPLDPERVRAVVLIQSSKLPGPVTDDLIDAAIAQVMAVNLPDIDIVTEASMHRLAKVMEAAGNGHGGFVVRMDHVTGEFIPTRKHLDVLLPYLIQAFPADESGAREVLATVRVIEHFAPKGRVCNVGEWLSGQATGGATLAEALGVMRFSFRGADRWVDIRLQWVGLRFRCAGKIVFIGAEMQCRTRYVDPPADPAAADTAAEDSSTDWHVLKRYPSAELGVAGYASLYASARKNEPLLREVAMTMAMSGAGEMNDLDPENPADVAKVRERIDLESMTPESAERELARADRRALFKRRVRPKA